MKKQKTGFTLIELLVVIAIIALLLSIVMPAMRRAKFIAKRVVCSSQMKEGVLAFLYYGTTEGEGKLPLGAMGRSSLSAYEKGEGWSQLDWIHKTSWLPVAENLKDTRCMICPILVPIWYKQFGNRPPEEGESFNGEPFLVSPGWEAYKLGYNYHGGHFAQAWPASRMPDVIRWTSPYRMTDPGHLTLLSCFITRSDNRDNTTIVHAPGGYLQGQKNQDPSDISGAAGSGGNIGHMDGSVAWKPLEKMDRHHRAKGFNDYPIQPGSTILTGYW